MQASALDALKRRIGRVMASMKSNHGSSFSQEHGFADGETHTVAAIGIKSPEQLEDELRHAFILLWSFKDYLKCEAADKGRSPHFIEDIVNRHVSLQLVADIANGSKHRRLTISRSGRFATLAEIGVIIPQVALTGITYGDQGVSTLVAHPELVEYTARIVAADGQILADAFNTLDQALVFWETEGLGYVQ